ncbi:MAG: PEP-CTERM sorting domain-containing protein [Pirellulales bacterium]
MNYVGRLSTASIAISTVWACLTIAAVTPERSLAGQAFENFDDDPGWEGHNNQLVSSTSRTVTQDFGYRTSNHAGTGAGEIGGIVDRSPLDEARYAEVLAPLNLEQTLSFSGGLSLLRASHTSGFTSSSDIFIGFFDSHEQSWRPPNFLGFRLRGHNEPSANVASIEMSYGTSTWAAGGIDWGQTVLPNGARHAFQLNYQPNLGNGRLTLSWDGPQILSLDLPAPHRSQGAAFDRFGIFSNLLPGVVAGNVMEAYFDDLTVNGVFHDFSVNPNWDGVGNKRTFTDPYLYGVNDFGHRTTNHAGGSPGELGGLMWRVEDSDENLQAYYADDVGNVNLGDRLVASGKIAADRFSTDAGLMLGWFNAGEQDWPPSNFVGVYMDSLSSVGRFFTPMYGTAAGSYQYGNDPFLLLPPDGTPRPWIVDYDPNGAGGLGTLTVTLDGDSRTITLEPGHKAQGATLNRFGIFNMQDNNGKHAVIYLDDISYTSALVPEPSSVCLLALGGLALLALHLRRKQR